ncbi:MAG: HAMP domain-containing histidine kinase [Desulfobacter sp.]|nr:MAG: HAMP domain-containing histidine kinase [Desulfobacter sp.]
MKIKRLYIKILISCIGILTVTITMILALFMCTAGRSYKSYLDAQTFSKLKVFQVMVQETVDLHPGLPPAENPELVKLLNTYASLFGIQLWITNPAETVLFKTFEGPVNMPRSGHRQVHHDRGITLYHYVLRWIKYYATIPINSGGAPLHLHLFIDTRDPNHPEGLFLAGLLVIGCVAALLVVPMASFITRRINLLNQSAIEFANGNLSIRTDISGQDEIAKLGDSFNLMADRLEKLIHNAKELTANVSHELRSPLARIRVSKELILDRLEQEPPDGGEGNKETKAYIQRHIKNMDGDINDLDTLVEHMLSLSKMNYQESALSRESFSFARFLETELGHYQSLLRQSDLAIDLDISGPLMVCQDRAALKSILSNLLDNAVKYSPPGSTLHIAARRKGKQGIEFSVTNPAPPLSPGQLENLFEPFFRLGGQSAPGSGLGLTIAKKQAGRCNGQILAENTPLGLCLSVRLP